MEQQLPITSRNVTVTDKDGQSVSAQLQLCGCGAREWFIYTIPVRGKCHTHLQCVECDETYCDQACERSEANAGFEVIA